jgi:hypothetical protein
MHNIGVLPIFSGKIGTIAIDDFFTEMERWFLTNDTRGARWPGIIDANIDYPAKSDYDTARNLGVAPGIVNIPNAAPALPGADAAARQAAADAAAVAF